MQLVVKSRVIRALVSVFLERDIPFVAQKWLRLFIILPLIPSFLLQETWCVVSFVSLMSPWR